MIAFDLECASGHLFEGWFESLEAFESQRRKKMISCPCCNDANIKKVISPVAVKKSNPSMDSSPGAIDYQKLAKEIVDYVKQNFDDVGPRFASEALRIHCGVAEKRNIRGVATFEEEKALKDEGIEFFKIPVLMTEDDKKN